MGVEDHGPCFYVRAPGGIRAGGANGATGGTVPSITSFAPISTARPSRALKFASTRPGVFALACQRMTRWGFKSKTWLIGPELPGLMLIKYRL